MIRKRFIEIFIILITFSAIFVIYSFYQTQISYNEGKGWDGQSYYSVAKQFCENKDIVEDAPFVNRIGTPYLVSLLVKAGIIGADNLIFGFKLINIIASLICVLLLYYWLYLNNLKFLTNYIIILIFLSSWISLLRFSLFYPVWVDPLFLVFILLGLIFINKYVNKKKTSYIIFLSILSIIGIFLRESYIIIPISFIFVNNPVNFNLKLSRNNLEQRQFCLRKMFIGIVHFIKKQYILLLPLVLSLLTFYFVKRIVTPTNNVSFLYTASVLLLNKSVILYLAGIFIAFGPIIIFLIIFWKYVYYLLKSRQWCIVFLMLVFILAFIGGSDTERILYWGFPLIFLLFAKILEKYHVVFRNIQFLIIIIVSQIISGRVFWIIPDYPNEFKSQLPLLSYLTNNFPYLDLYSSHGNTIMILIGLGEYIVLTLLFFVLTNKIRLNNLIKNRY